MDACVKSATLSGVDGRVLEVTAAAEPGLPGFEQHGMHGWGLGQRAERAWSAVTASGLPWPRSKITVTVAPDWLPKHDTAVDLAMTVAVLAADCTVPAHNAAGIMYYAGLGTDGRLTPVPGVLPAAVEVRTVAHGTLGACITAISEDRIRQLTDAGRAWIREHDTRYDDLWVVIVTVDPEGSAGLVAGNAAEVA